ncbi:hypothetical protein AwErysi_04870 [Erysipelotrichaceae bacterium]|nr:hypothetical protein AwErysi_04870 [Erysipelotrichaceae bacterium]
MEEISNNNKKIFLIWVLLALGGSISLFIIAKALVLGYLFGSIAGGICLAISYITFKKMYADKSSAPTSGAIGTLPKLLVLVAGAIISKNMPEFFNIGAYILGFFTYIIAYVILWILDFIKVRKG